MVNVGAKYIQEPDAVTLEMVLQKGLSPRKWFVCVWFYFCVLELISVIESIAKCEKQLFLFMFSLTFCWHLFPLNSSSVLHLDFRLNLQEM